MVSSADERSAVRWGDLAWPDVSPASRGVLGNDVALVPVGATEQHGPHLPTGTDTFVAVALCERASAATGALVLPAVSVGASFGHGTDYPGTLSFSPELLASILREYAAWAALSGIRRLLFVNAHGGNQAAVEVALDHLRFARPDLRAGAFHWWMSDPRVLAELVADGSDIHANRGETSVMLALAPELVHLDRMLHADDADRTDELVFRYTASSLSRNGVTGRPSEATAEMGETIIGWAVDTLVDRIGRGRIEEPPFPPPARVPLHEISAVADDHHPTWKGNG
jgi:creatinine amidohydrolase